MLRWLPEPSLGPRSKACKSFLASINTVHMGTKMLKNTLYIIFGYLIIAVRQKRMKIALYSLHGFARCAKAICGCALQQTFRFRSGKSPDMVRIDKTIFLCLVIIGKSVAVLDVCPVHKNRLPIIVFNIHKLTGRCKLHN